MSGSDQEETLEARAESPEADRVATPVDQGETLADAAGGPGPARPGSARPGLAPSQARRLRIAAASVLMVALAVVLVVRLASRSSVLVVGVYGLALILCGVVIELSRRGRTRLGSYLLGAGLLVALAADRFLIP